MMHPPDLTSGPLVDPDVLALPRKCWTSRERYQPGRISVFGRESRTRSPRIAIASRKCWFAAQRWASLRPSHASAISK